MAAWLQAFLHTEGRIPVPKRVDEQALFGYERVVKYHGRMHTSRDWV